MPNREARTEVFSVTILSACLAIWINRQMSYDAESLVHVIIVTYVVNLMIGMGINLFWKISVHMMAICGSLAILMARSRKWR
jgi:hypothetical protein